MSTERINEQDPRIQAGLAELQALIEGRFPEASFTVRRGEDPAGVYLRATVDIEDPDEVVDVVIDRLLELQVEERLPVYVIPLRPPEKVLAELAQRQRRPSAIGRATLPV